MQVHLPCLLRAVKVLWQPLRRYCPATPRFRTTHRYPLLLSQLNTSAVGVKKVSPIRRARPDEDRPRAPQLTRRQREERAAENARRVQLRAARPVAPPAPLPDPAQEYPQIEVNAQSYQLLRQLLTAEPIAKPGSVSWSDIEKLFQDIGFGSSQGAGGSALVFQPGNFLRNTQVSHTLKFRSKWIQVLHFWAHPVFPRLPSPSLEPTPKCLKLIDTSIGSLPTYFETPST